LSPRQTPDCIIPYSKGTNAIPKTKKIKNKMASLAGHYLRRRISQISAQLNHSKIKCLFPSRGTRWFSNGTESSRTEFPGENAYDLLGVSETSSFAEIKASFRKLAKETHPDLAESKNDLAASQRFVQILAAYEVLCSQLY
jgi:DnaJ-domain-containing protein 1